MTSTVVSTKAGHATFERGASLSDYTVSSPTKKAIKLDTLVAGKVALVVNGESF